MDLNKLTMGDKIVAGAGIVLIIGLFAFPWHNIEFDFGFGAAASETRSAIESPNGFWGVLALLLALVLVGVVLAEKLGNVNLPDLPIPWNDAKFYAAIAILALLVIKLVVETDFLGWGAWINLLLAAGIAYGGFLIKKEGAGASTTPPSAF